MYADHRPAENMGRTDARTDEEIQSAQIADISIIRSLNASGGRGEREGACLDHSLSSEQSLPVRNDDDTTTGII